MSITCFAAGLTDVTVNADVDAVDFVLDSRVKITHFRTLGVNENVFCIIFVNIYVE